MGGLLENRKALITGAATGIGAAIVDEFIKQGATVAAHARSIERLQPLLDKHSHGIIAVVADLESDTEINAMCNAAIELLGGIDIVVNNAGYSLKAPVLETTDALWDKTMQINLKAPFLITRNVLPTMKQSAHGGRIIFNSSIAAKLPDPVGSAYNTSKAGLLGLVKCLAAELGQYNITVNAICPGWVNTPMAVSLHEAMFDGNRDEFDNFYNAATSGNMLGQQIQPQDIANFASYLASDKARYITAQAMNVCAGLCPV